jgi:hypothetical protein
LGLSAGSGGPGGQNSASLGQIPDRWTVCQAVTLRNSWRSCGSSRKQPSVRLTPLAAKLDGGRLLNTKGHDPQSAAHLWIFQNGPLRRACPVETVRIHGTGDAWKALRLHTIAPIDMTTAERVAYSQTLARDYQTLVTMKCCQSLEPKVRPLIIHIAVRQGLSTKEVFRPMTRSVNATKKIVEVGKKHVLDHRLRIERHKELTAKLERDGDPDVIAKARQLLADMEQTLAGLQAEYAAAQEALCRQ